MEASAIARKTENAGFTCAHCAAEVAPLTNGSCRNHCPSCLWSRHVDELPGDRQSTCCGLMEPIAVDYRAPKGYLVVHRCTRWGHVRPNRVADDPLQPDDLAAIIELVRWGS